jgi:hypothetical protein
MRRLFVCVLLAGCIRAPEIVLVDRATALEQQAAGSFAELEKKLTHAALQPRPMGLTPEQLEALGIPPPSLVDRTDKTDADRVDDLVKQHCLGESKQGTLVDTPDACKGAADRGQAIELVERTNAARQQLWRWMKERQPASTVEQLRRQWRESHLKAVACGGWIQRDDGQWEAKQC